MTARLISAILTCTMSACSPSSEEPAGPIRVEITSSESGYELMRGGKPYTVKGAGMVIDDIERFAGHGGNSIRNWTTTGEYQDVQGLLDSAQAHDVTVALCLPMIAERHGFDYDDSQAVAAQLVGFREEVLKYRDHPALLVWIIGNELNHSYTNPAVWNAVNDVARMIHDLDPNHPATTALSGFEQDVIFEIQSRAPELDFISFQTYGSLFALPEHIREARFTRPFMVTEWGTLGYWDMEQTSWGAPVELTSSEKADVIRRGRQDILARLDKQLLGSYVFFWGQKQERTPTWFGMLTAEGHETEAVDVMHHAWTGGWPANRSPRVEALRLAGRGARDSVTLTAGEAYTAEFEVHDYENDPLRYKWEIKPESGATQTGGDFEESLANVEGALSDPLAPTTMLTAPAPGTYRLFAYAYDDYGHAAHANIPFLVRARGAE